MLTSAPAEQVSTLARWLLSR